MLSPVDFLSPPSSQLTAAFAPFAKSDSAPSATIRAPDQDQDDEEAIFREWLDLERVNSLPLGDDPPDGQIDNSPSSGFSTQMNPSTDGVLASFGAHVQQLTAGNSEGFFSFDVVPNFQKTNGCPLPQPLRLSPAFHSPRLHRPFLFDSSQLAVANQPLPTQSASLDCSPRPPNSAHASSSLLGAPTAPSFGTLTSQTPGVFENCREPGRPLTTTSILSSSSAGFSSLVAVLDPSLVSVSSTQHCDVLPCSPGSHEPFDCFRPDALNSTLGGLGPRNQISGKMTRRSSSPAPTFTNYESSSHQVAAPHPHQLVGVPDWQDRPTPEEYRLLSSKEKRQLRNKISARNFRHRRKEHISALEQQVTQRDQQIESLCHELTSVREENSELKTEVNSLKSKWSDLMKKLEEVSLGAASTPAAPPALNSANPAFPHASPPAVFCSSPRLRSVKSGAVLAMPNLHKDLGSHTRKPFNGAGAITGGNVGVHTTLIPDIPVDLYHIPATLSDRLVNLKLEDVQDSLSPQAMMEVKRPADLVISNGSLSVFKQVKPPNIIQKLEGTVPNPEPGLLKTGLSRLWPCPPLEVTGELRLSNHNLRQALTQLLVEALRERSGPSGPFVIIDKDKLSGLLQGTLELQAVEAFSPPPPYVPCVEQVEQRVS